MRDDHDEDESYALPSRRRMRLLPLTLTMLALLLVIKVNELYIGSRELRELYTAHDASAEPQAANPKDAKPADAVKPADATADTSKPADAKPGDATKPADIAADPKDAASAPAVPVLNGTKSPDAAPGAADAIKPSETPAQADVKAADAAKTDASKKDGDKKDADKKPDDKNAKPVEEPKTYGTGHSTVKQIEAMKARDAAPQFSQSEIDLLQNLSKHREELDQREKDLDLKAKVLDATQKRINDKLEEMKTLEEQLSKVVAQYNEKQGAEIDSLVKIYQNMKPDQAALIFNQLDMPILLEVIGKMSERKVSPILALMDPKRARDVTEQLATMRKTAPKAPTTPGK